MDNPKHGHGPTSAERRALFFLSHPIFKLRVGPAKPLQNGRHQ